ncbi:pyrroline-5-carboxylate reductase [bacterium]|nr:pyrroline-5-carboxylate reductase [bacterium]
MTTLAETTIAFIGSGAMAGADDGRHPSHVAWFCPVRSSPPTAPRTRGGTGRKHGLRYTPENAEAAAEADLLVLAVKPQIMDSVVPAVRAGLRAGVPVLSIAAGYPIVKLIEGTGSDRIARAMPNTPGQIGMGMTAWTATGAVAVTQREQIAAILGALGEVLYVKDERFIDMATAINGSGPAYVFLLLEAMIDAGVQLGFSRVEAQQLATQTILGSLHYAVESGLHPAELRNQVTSPAGTTAAGLYALEKGGARALMYDAILAAYRLPANWAGTMTFRPVTRRRR